MLAKNHIELSQNSHSQTGTHRNIQNVQDIGVTWIPLGSRSNYGREKGQGFIEFSS